MLANQALEEYERRARNPQQSADVGESLLLLARARGALHDESGMRDAARRGRSSRSARRSASITKACVKRRRSRAARYDWILSRSEL